MKKVIMMLAALAPFATIIAADKPEKSPEEESAEKAARVRAMAAEYAPCTVNVRFRMKTLQDGSRPDAWMQYRCPACGNSSLHVSKDNEKELPCLVTGFVMADNRVLVQDIALRGEWLDGLEVVCGTNATPARPITCYPDENAVLLETEHPLAGARPLAFTGDATNEPSLFHLVTDVENDPYRLRNDVVNREIRRFCDGKTVFWCDFSDRLLDKNGDTKWVMPDRLHPGAQGYEIWYEEVKPYIAYALSDGANPPPKNRYSRTKTAFDKANAALRATEIPATRIEGLTPKNPKRGDWWTNRMFQKRNQIAASKGEIDLVFFGDSITHNWERSGNNWLKKLSETYSILDIGYGGDRTQHLVWRGLNGELDGYKAKCIMLMIGTNNARADKPENVVKGIRRILDIIAAKQPQAKTILLPIFPRGEGPENPLRKNNEQVNAVIKGFADGQKVIWCDFNAKYLDAKGDTKWIMGDRLHPGDAGYKIWTEAVLPHFKSICGK